MQYIINTENEYRINLSPANDAEEILQNLYFLYSSVECDCPLDESLGLKATYIDRPLEVAKALMVADIYDKTEQYEPRAEIKGISFIMDYGNGILKPIVEVKIEDGSE